jgi:hypothetical protein
MLADLSGVWIPTEDDLGGRFRDFHPQDIADLLSSGLVDF